MKKLTENQKEFLLNVFFAINTCTNWRNIALKLIEDGKCIVAGREPIWRGGIGNFIKVTDAEGSVGCSLYTFNLEQFKSSLTFGETLAGYLTELLNEKKQLDQKYDELNNF